MKLYHFALVFAVIACGSMVAIQVSLLNERNKAELRQTERDCLVSAADDMAEELFTGNKEVSMAKVSQAGEIFFQSLSLCRNGAADMATDEYWKKRLILVVFEKNGYYRFSYDSAKNESWEFFSYGEKESVESGMKIPSVLAILTTAGYGTGQDSNGKICVASGRTETKYYVTQDGEYHIPECGRCKEEKVIFCYATPIECARNGAFPCESCLRQ